MKDSLKKMMLAALPLAGLLWGATPALARDNWRHERFHDRLGETHEEFHDQPSSRREHRRFHRWLNREHGGFHYDRDNRSRRRHHQDGRWDSRYDDRWNRSDWYSGREDWRFRDRRAQYRPRYDRTWSGNERYYDSGDGYAPFRYADPMLSGAPWWSVLLDR